jgi:hypothetical protein
MQSVFSGEDDVENDEIVLVHASLECSILAIRGGIYGVTLLSQAFRKHLRGGGLVFHEENPQFFVLLEKEFIPRVL